LHKGKKGQKGTKAAGQKSRVSISKKLATFHVAQWQGKAEKLQKVMEKRNMYLHNSVDKYYEYEM